MTLANFKDIVIIGAGVIGASIAYHLSCRTECGVTVLERNRVGSGASEHSFAWVNAFGKDPRDYHLLNRRSLEMWYRLERQLDMDIGIHSGGEMRWVNSESHAVQLERRIRQLQAWGYPCRLLTFDEMMALEPGLRPGEVAAASYSDADVHVETDKFIAICLEKARESGAEVSTNTNVTDFRIQHERVKAVITSDFEYPCDILIVAGGVETPQLAARVGVHVPQQQSAGIVIRTTSCAQVLQRVAVLHVPSRQHRLQSVHLRQLRDGTLRIGHGTQECLTCDDSQEHADRLLATVRDYMPKIGNIEAIPTPVGYRPMPLDGYPIIGFTEAVRNMYLAFMHSGVTLAPLVGEMAALEIAGGVAVDCLRPYRLERFA